MSQRCNFRARGEPKPFQPFEEECDPGPAHGDAEDEGAVDDVEDVRDPEERGLREGQQREHEEEPPHAAHQQELDVQVEVHLEVLHAPAKAGNRVTSAS